LHDALFVPPPHVLNAAQVRPAVFPGVFVQSALRVCVPLFSTYEHVPLLTVQPLGVQAWLVLQLFAQLTHAFPLL
jgi:hypothetical protein